LDPRIKKFSRTVAQTVELAGFGPCTATDGIISVQAFDEIKRYEVTPDLTIKGVTKVRKPVLGMLSPRTRAVQRIIYDAYVSRGIPEPGHNASLMIGGEGIPFAVEVRYLWMVEPTPDHVEDQRLVIATALIRGEPVWACESTIAYQSKKDSDLPNRVAALAATYRESLAPNTELLAVFPEIVEAVTEMVK